jgi:hypothetical protein
MRLTIAIIIGCLFTAGCATPVHEALRDSGTGGGRPVEMQVIAFDR